MRRKWLLLLVPMMAGVVLAADYLSTPARDLRQFDPTEVARLDTVMWRAYYDRERLKLLRQLSQLLRQQYHLSRTQSITTAYRAAKAALIFKDGHTREDYEKALPDLVAFYRMILGPERSPEQTAKLELEWWIIHRERASRPPGELDSALAQLQAEIYQQPADAFLEHGRLRAQAMLIRDEKAGQGKVSDEDWEQIRSLLDQSWTALHTAVAEPAISSQLSALSCQLSAVSFGERLRRSHCRKCFAFAGVRGKYRSGKAKLRADSSPLTAA